MKLTNSDRDGIISKAVIGKFEKQDADLKKRENDLALKAYAATFDAKIVRLAAKLPEKWVSKDSCLRFNAGGYRVNLITTKPVLVPRNAGYCSELGVLTGDIANEVQDFAREKEKAKADQEAVRVKLKSLIYSISTLKRLKELWPEGKKFYAHLDKIEKAGGLPAVQFGDVNAILGLTKKAEPAAT